jgi:hypothetical protein
MNRTIFTLLLIICISSGASLGADQDRVPEQIDPFQLALTLKSAREYGRRLERAALDFVCREEVSELIDLTRDTSQSLVERNPTAAVISGERNPYQRPDIKFNTGQPKKGHQNAYIYDYQMTRQAGEVREKRVLLEKNGKKAKDKQGAQPTLTYQYAEILLAAARLIDERYEEYYDYRLVREDRLGDEDVWVLAVSPRLAAGGYLGGSLWLRRRDYAILKVDWDPSTFGNYQNILKRAEAYKARPRVVSRTEFAVEKNGLLFPSLDLTEEAYVQGDDDVFLRARTRVAYLDYRFFTVETEAEFKKRSPGP